MMRILLLLALLAPDWGAAEEKLGRLFLSPDVRGRLDSLRQTSRPPEGSNRDGATAINDAADARSPVSALGVQGFVTRSDGKGTVWVNRQPLRETSSRGGVRVGRLGTDGSVRLKLSGNDKEVVLKAGQIYDPVTGAVAERARDLPVSDPSARTAADARETP